VFRFPEGRFPVDSAMPVDLEERLRSLVDAWRAGDALRAAAHFSPEAVYREAGREPLMGRAAIAAHFTRFFRDGPLWEFLVDDIIASGERAVVVYRFSVKGPDGEWRERAGTAVVRFDQSGSVAAWREYEG